MVIQLKTFTIVSRNKGRASALVRELRMAGFSPCRRSVSSHASRSTLRRSHAPRSHAPRPSFVISLGGDGTYLYAERKYPGIPKLLIRDNSICNQCNDATFQEIVYALKTRRYTIRKNPSLSCVSKQGSRLIRQWCTNDFILRNKDPTQALRFTLSVGGKPVNGTLVGDGVAIATPFGSTAYFHSITHKKFDRGIGVAFNNLTVPRQPLILPPDTKIIVSIVRNEAQFAADNSPSVLTLKPGSSITITSGTATAKIITLKVGLKGMFEKLFMHRRRSLV